MSDTLRNRYKVDLRDFEFQFFEQAKLGDILGQGPFAAWGPDEIRMVLEQAKKFAYEVTGPLNGYGDTVGCKVVDGHPVTPEGYKNAFDKSFELGLKQIAFPEEFGGQSGPHTLQMMVEEMLSGSNTAFNMYPSLSLGAAEVIVAFGTKAQKEMYIERMTNGTWGGTMCLTEPHAGSDVGAATTKAVKLADGRYKISGTKIFISGGDHDLTPNIVHLVLARVEGAPAGTKGLTLFIVPKNKINADGSTGSSNDVTLGGIEHKMGIVSNATCILNFGENDDCYGEPVGGVENEGIKQMFVMMNHARLVVALQSLGVASQAYLCALSYAKERKQGPSVANFKDANAPKVTIINHPDVRRMLLEMKAKVEGLRALVIRLAGHHDRSHVFAGKDEEKTTYHKGQIELLTPIAKAYGSDQAFRIGEIAVQVHGGAGFIKDYGVEQDVRDSKIFSIYEGTNHIQSLDLVARKLGQRGGANLMAFIGEVQAFCETHKAHPVFASSVASLATASEVIGSGAMRFLGWGQTNNIPMVALQANRYLEMFSEFTIGYLLLEGGAIAYEALQKGSSEKDFYDGKVQTALWFARNILPLLPAKAELLGLEDESPMQIRDESFATV
jgi:hypothetical protein